MHRNIATARKATLPLHQAPPQPEVRHLGSPGQHPGHGTSRIANPSMHCRIVTARKETPAQHQAPPRPEVRHLVPSKPQHIAPRHYLSVTEVMSHVHPHNHNATSIHTLSLHTTIAGITFAREQRKTTISRQQCRTRYVTPHPAYVAPRHGYCLERILP